jgi:hypothetical protein
MWYYLRLHACGAIATLSQRARALMNSTGETTDVSCHRFECQGDRLREGEAETGLTLARG